MLFCFSGGMHSFFVTCKDFGEQVNKLNRGYDMSANALNLLNQLRKRDKMQGFLNILSLFRNKLNKFINTGA